MEKKAGHAGGQERDDVQEMRKAWMETMSALPVSRLFPVDECTSMGRSRGWFRRR